MMLKNATLIKSLWLTFLFPIIALGQSPEPTIDESRLERPAPIVVAKTRDPERCLSLIRSVIENQGFRIVKEDASSPLFEAIKADLTTKDWKSEDKIIVWVERDFREPTKYLRIYLLFAHYEEQWTRKGKGLCRIANLTDDFINSHTGELKKALLKIGEYQ